MGYLLRYQSIALKGHRLLQDLSQNSNSKLPTHALILDQVSHSFDGKLVLDKVSIGIRPGDSVVLIGPSGHGKSTLLKILAGLLKPERGSASVFGKNWNLISKKEQNALQTRMGLLFQKNALFDSMTVGENIAFPIREVKGFSELEIQKMVDSFLDSVGILHAKNLFPDEISGGMQKRLGIARALALSPEIVFYDDPTAGLDPITSRKIIDLILDLKKQHRSTIVTITNDMNRAYQLAGRIIMVVDKSAIETGGVHDTKSYPDPRVQQFILGKTEGPLTKGTK